MIEWTVANMGIAVGGGGGFILLLFLCFSCDGQSDDYLGAGGDEPPDAVGVSPQGDEVSTLAAPQVQGGTKPSNESLAGYEDPSVATVDYDYSKAYGGGGDTSVSSAGGTFGSNTQGQSALDPQNAAATGAALGGGGSFSDGDSFDAAYRDPSATVKEELSCH
jgi:hypothetical protein